MEYDVIRIGNITIDKKNVLLFEINGVSAENYSVAKLKKLYFKPNIKLKFENNGELYCKAADMLFIFSHNGKEKYMFEFELPYETDDDGENKCEITTQCGGVTYIEIGAIS